MGQETERGKAPDTSPLSEITDKLAGYLLTDERGRRMLISNTGPAGFLVVAPNGQTSLSFTQPVQVDNLQLTSQGTQTDDISDEFKDKFFKMQSEVFRLNCELKDMQELYSKLQRKNFILQDQLVEMKASSWMREQLSEHNEEIKIGRAHV